MSIAAPARQQARLQPTQMQRVIQRLCRDHWLTRSELGELLQRNSDGLRSRSLAPMVDAGQLVLRYPETPNRPDQAYRAATNSNPQSGEL